MIVSPVVAPLVRPVPHPIVGGESSGVDFPLSLKGQGLTALYRPTAEYVTLSGSAITQISDPSGNAFHATQATGSRQPTWTTRRGQPVASFDSGDWMSIASVLGLGANNWTLCSVHEVTSTAAARTILSVGNGSNGMALVSNDASNGSRTVRASAVNFCADGAASTATEVWIAGRNAGTMFLYVNGVSQALTNSTTSVLTPTTGSTIGAISGSGTSAWLGYIWEIMAFNGVFSAAQIAAYWSFWQARLGL